MARSLGDRQLGSRLQADEWWTPVAAARLDELTAVLTALQNPPADPDVHPDRYTTDTLKALREMRSIIDTATRDLVEVGHLRYKVSQRSLAAAAGLSTQTVNKWVREPVELSEDM